MVWVFFRCIVCLFFFVFLYCQVLWYELMVFLDHLIIIIDF